MSHCRRHNSKSLIQKSSNTDGTGCMVKFHQTVACRVHAIKIKLRERCKQPNHMGNLIKLLLDVLS